jgi:hypothetical protein
MTAAENTSRPPPPYNPEAEQWLLGAILIDNKVYHRVVDLVLCEDFGNSLHQRIRTEQAQSAVDVNKTSRSTRSISGSIVQPSRWHAPVPVGAINDRRLGHAIFRVFCSLLGFADQEGYCNPSAATIGKALVIARPTVSEHIDKLICGQLIASPAKIREFFAVLANGGDAGDTNGDGPAGEMTTDGVVELSRGRRRPDR